VGSSSGTSRDQDNWWTRLSPERKLEILIVPIVVALIGAGVPLLSALLDDDPAPERDVPRFSGIAGNFAEGRAFLEFLEDNDGDAVLLDEVGFPEAILDDHRSEDVQQQDGKVVREVVAVRLWTDCEPPIPSDETPEHAKGCESTTIEIRGQLTEDSQAFLTHGVPVYDGYFRVDVTGLLQMGNRPISLQPISHEEATGLG
jgi:hypothetical protein